MLASATMTKVFFFTATAKAWALVRSTQDIEPCADALERKRRGRPHVAEGLLRSKFEHPIRRLDEKGRDILDKNSLSAPIGSTKSGGLCAWLSIVEPVL